MKTSFFTCFVMILGLNLGFAQESFFFDGQLLDAESREAISNGMINLISKDSLQILDFEQASRQGFFHMPLPKEQSISSFLISIDAIGYERFLLSLDTISIEEDQLIYLQPTSYSLKEVLIEDIPPVKQSVDTIAFDPRSYMDSTERTLEDLLGKLPGVDVDKDGKVSLGNQEIKSILIDGDDLSGNDYRLISQNLPIELVKRLEFISNYVENTLLAGFDAPEFLVLNVETDKEKTQKPSLNLELGLGNAETSHASSNSLALLNKTKLINVNHWQSLGEELQLPLAKPWQGLEGVTPIHPLINGDQKDLKYQQPQIGIPSEFIPTRFNRSAWGKLRLHIKPNKYLKSFLEVAADRDRADQFMDISRSFFAGDRQFDVQESYDLSSLDQNLHFQLKNQVYTGPKSNLTTYSSFMFGDGQAHSDLDLQNNVFDVQLASRHFRQDHKLAWIRKMNAKNMLILDGSFSSFRASQDLLVQSAVAREVGRDSSTYVIPQGLSSSLSSFMANLRWIYKLGPSLFFHAAVRSGRQKESFQSTLYQKTVTNSEVKLRYQSPRLLVAFVNVQLGQMDLQLMDSRRSEFSVQVNHPFIYGQFWLGKKKLTYNWNLSYNFRQAVAELDQVNQHLYWDTYRSLSVGDSSIAIGNSHEWQARISFQSNLTNLNRFTSYGQISYSISDLPYQNNFVLDSLFLINQWQRGESQLQSLKIFMGVEKYLSPLKTAIKLKPSFAFNRYNNAVENVQRLLSSYHFRLMSTLRTATSSPIDIMLGEEASWNLISIQSTPSSSPVRSFSLSAYADLMLHLHKRLELVFRNEWFRIRVQDQPANNFTFQEFTLEFEAWKNKKIDVNLKLSGKNLRNVSDYGINSVTDYYSYFSRIRLRPRTFLLSCDIGF